MEHNYEQEIAELQHRISKLSANIEEITKNNNLEYTKCKQEIEGLQLRITELSGKPMPTETIPTKIEKVETPLNGTKMKLPALAAQRSKSRQIISKSIPEIKPSPTMKKDLEGHIGKNLFAIIATILILLGVGIFISTIYEYIPEFVKVVAIYAFGFAMVGLGLSVYSKSKNNFWLGLASCGTAELLVSIMASYTYFKVLSLPFTYLLILLWVIGTFYLTKIKPALFKTIGYIGFLNSIMLGISLLESSDGSMFVALFISYVAINMLFIFTHKELPKLNLAIMYVGMICLTLFSSTEYFILGLQFRWPFSGYDELMGVSAFSINLHVLIVLTIALFNVIHLRKYKQYNASYAIFSGLSFIAIMVYIIDGIYNEVIAYSMITLLMTAFWTLNLIKCGANKKNILHDIVAMPAYLLITFLALIAGAFSKQVDMSLLAIIIPIIVFTILYIKTHDYASGGMALLLFCGLSLMNFKPILLIYMFCTILSVMLFSFCRKETNYGLIIKNGWYIWILLSIIKIFNELAKIASNFNNYQMVVLSEDILFVLAIAVISFINLYRIFKTAYVKNVGFLRTPESIFLYSVHGIIISTILEGIAPRITPMNFFIHMILTMILFILLFMTVLQPLNAVKNKQTFILLQCMKLAFYFWIVMEAFNVELLIKSIIMLSIAIVSIMIGFKLSSKYTRIYGLILSFVSSISLVLFSVSFDSTLQVAGGIILCGLLCFVISFIYSKAAKSFQDNEDLEQKG